MESKMTAWSGRTGSRVDCHRVVIQANSQVAALPRIGFKGKQKVVRGSVVRRQLSVDDPLLISGSKCHDSTLSSELSQSFSYYTTSVDSVSFKLPRSPPPPKPALVRLKTSLSVWSFPSCAESNLLLKMLGNNGITGTGKEDCYSVATPALSKGTETPSFPKLLEEPPLVLTPILRPDHVNSVEIKVRHRRKRIFKGKYQSWYEKERKWVEKV